MLFRSEFLDQFTKSQTYREQIDAGKGGRLKQGVSIPILQDLKVPLPSLPEQRAIAQVLRTVEQAKEATQKMIAATKQLKQSLTVHLLRHGPVPRQMQRGGQTSDPICGDLPADWTVLDIGALISDGPQNGIYKPASCYGSGTPILRIDEF